MEGNPHSSPKLGYPVDGDDGKYVSGLSTILVATIQEAKDRISQIEYIFCSQLYPNFQSRSKSLQKIYLEARKAAEDTWKEKENELLIQLEKLQLQKQQSIEENDFLKLEKENQLKEQEEKTNLLLAKLSNQQDKVDELEKELRQKSKEVDEGMELQKKLLLLIQSKETAVVNRAKQLKEHEEKINVLLAKLNGLDGKVNELQGVIREKTEEVAKGKQLTENLLKKIEVQALEIMNYEELLNNHDKEKKLLHAKLKPLEEKVMNFDELLNNPTREKKLPKANLEPLEEKVGRIQEELRKRTEEVEEGRKLHDQLLQQINLNGLELLKNKQQLEEHEKEKVLLLDKVKCFEEKANQQQVNIREQTDDVAEELSSYQDLLRKVELKTSELQAEKKKRRDTIDAYKRLKSQYTFLCTKFGLSTENILPQIRLDDGSDLSRHHQNLINSPGFGNRLPKISAEACEMNKVKTETSCEDNLEYDKRGRVTTTSSSHSSTSSLFVEPKCPSNVKSAPVAGTKRPASYWRDTRSRQDQAGPDPHDDFLSTPCENIKRNLNKIVKENHDIPDMVLRGTNSDSLDDETQDINANPSSEKQPKPSTIANKGGFKYVEPVRKKAERENLKGFECKQCKKFYDAVLPDNEGEDNNDGNKRSFRCEHHEGVSRHRYRYVPPLTPEGFWNIGFDSEMNMHCCLRSSVGLATTREATILSLGRVVFYMQM